MDEQDVVDNMLEDSPVDLLAIIRDEALRFLPAKTLCRFKTVCKDWNVHISSRYFSFVHSETFRDISGFFIKPPPFLYDKPKLHQFLSLDANAYGVPNLSLNYFSREIIHVMDSSNGLICCREKTGLSRAFFVGNPVTKQWKKLPPLNYGRTPYPAVVLIVKPRRLSEKISAPQYTVVCGSVTNFSTGTFRFEKYSSGEERWKVCGVSRVDQDKVMELRYGVHVNGTVYWHTQHHNKILAFDIVGTERAKMIRANLGDNASGILGVMDGKLIITRVGRQSEIIVDVLSDENNEVWRDKYRIDFSSPVNVRVGLDYGLYFISPCNVLFTLENYLVMFVTGQCICSYNLKTTEVRYLGNVDDYHPLLARNTTIAHVNSLVPVG